MVTSWDHENSLPSLNTGPCTDVRTYVNSIHGFVSRLYIRVRAELICQCSAAGWFHVFNECVRAQCGRGDALANITDGCFIRPSVSLVGSSFLSKLHILLIIQLVLLYFNTSL